MSDLAAWLLEQIDADKQVAQDKADAASARWPAGAPLNSEVYPGNGHALIVDPCRVLAECDAKRRIVEAMQSNWNWSRSADCPEAERRGYYDMAAGLGDALRLLALPYADRPGYDESWRP